MIFIDGSNLYMSLKHQFAKARINVAKLMDKLAGGRPLVRAYYYSAPLDPADSPQEAIAQQRFFNALRQVPYLTLRMGKLVRRDTTFRCAHCGRTSNVTAHLQKGVDARIVADMLKSAMLGHYDVAILVSGDADLVDAVNAVKDCGKHVENAFARDSWARELQDAADKRIVLDNSWLSDVWL